MGASALLAVEVDMEVLRGGDSACMQNHLLADRLLYFSPQLRCLAADS